MPATTNKSKYQLVVNHVTGKIKAGEYKRGDRIPSINEFRELYQLSRDTVFAGLKELVSNGIIDAQQGVGYFVTTTKTRAGHHVFLLFNELNGFKEVLYNSFMNSIGPGVTVELFFHNYNRKMFDSLLKDANNRYTDYIIMSGKFQGLDPLLQTLSGRVFLLDHFHPSLKGKYSAVFQDFENDTSEALVSGLSLVKKYRKIYMVQKEEKEPLERYAGLTSFCKKYGFEHDYISSIKKIKAGDLFIVVKDEDLATLIKNASLQKLVPGKDFGIISYNDTPLKEVLAGGITTLSTDFKLMGETMAGFLDQKAIKTVSNPWRLNIRKSL